VGSPGWAPGWADCAAVAGARAITRGNGGTMPESSWPSVGVIIPTRDRPELLRRAVGSVLDQAYPGRIEVLAVFDQSAADPSLITDDPDRRVGVSGNDRSVGLAGARNTGIEALKTDLIAFCDDDDVWLPGKLTAQVRRLRAEPTAEFGACAIEVQFRDRLSARRTGTDSVTHAQLLRSRMAMLHSSTFIAWRDALLDGIGLVSEQVPGSMCEDWDLLLRAARRHPIAVVDEPLVRVLWGRTSFFANRWETKIAAHRWMLAQHPDIETSGVGAARVYGQLAFSHAALGRRGDTWRWARQAIVRRWREPRAYLALAVANRVVSADRVLATLHKRGRGV
jgi:glycosyltransferase involved in cell wall biosynthesis